MNNSNLNNLLNQYERKRADSIYEADKRKDELYKQNPKLQEIDDILSKEAIRTSMLMLNKNDPLLLAQLNTKIVNLKLEKEKILKQIGKDVNYLKPNFECNDCEDTGYITKGNNVVMCHCLKQKLFDLEYNKANIYNLKNQNFDNFSLEYFSNIPNEQKYNSKLSPRENIEKIKNLCLKFIENFDSEDQKNLLFVGNTGLGKTFLSSCIANELLKKGKTVLYQTAPVMLDTILDYRFGKNTSTSDIYNSLLNVDLLIIDDLGTESSNSMYFSELFNIINSRLLNPRKTKTIISTNLGINTLFSSYDERIVSRFAEHYDICKFYGDDIRFMKK